MEIISYFRTYLEFRHCMRGTSYNVGWVRRWCFPPMSDVVHELVDERLVEYSEMLPPESRFWEMLQRGLTFAALPNLAASLDFTTRGRAVASLGMVAFVLRHWPDPSPHSFEERLDLLCAPVWMRMQTLAQMEGMLAGAPAPRPAEESDDDSDAQVPCGSSERSWRARRSSETDSSGTEETDPWEPVEETTRF